MREVYEWMLATLKDGWLEVAKLPSRHGGYTRVVISCNAAWYSEFCRSYCRKRRRRWRREFTIIKRCHTIKALQRMIAGNTSGEYAERLHAMAEWLIRDSQ